MFTDFVSFVCFSLLLLQVELLLLLLSLKLLRSVSLAVFSVNYWKVSGVTFCFLLPLLFAVFYSVTFSTGIRIFTSFPSLGPDFHALISARKCLLPLPFFPFTVGIFHMKGVESIASMISSSITSFSAGRLGAVQVTCSSLFFLFV